MLERDLIFVQEKIGYLFKNKNLLAQSFKKRTNDAGLPNNEVMEFYGDRLLGLVIARNLFKENSSISLKGNFISQKDEGVLTQEFIEKSINEYLASRIEKLGFIDIYKKVNDKVDSEFGMKAEGDLFESILGAVAIDCDWDMKLIYLVANKMFSDSEITDDYENLVHKIAIERNLGNVIYSEDRPKRKYWICSVSIPSLKKNFISEGSNKSDTKLSAFAKTYRFLDFLYNDSDNEFAVTDGNESTIFDILVSRNLFPKPTYSLEFVTNVKDDEEPYWRCELSIKGFSKYVREASVSSKFAEKKAKERMLEFVMQKEPLPPKLIPLVKEEKKEPVIKPSVVWDKQDYVSQLYRKITKNIISEPIFEFDVVNRDEVTTNTCTAYFPTENTFPTENRKFFSEGKTKREAKQLVAKQLLEYINSSDNSDSEKESIIRGHGLLKYILSRFK